MEAAYVFIPLFVLGVALLGGYFTNLGMADGWYESLVLPAATPSGAAISAAWTVIFIFFALAMLITWREVRETTFQQNAVMLFIVNGAFNALWSYLFFVQHMIGAAFFEGMILLLTIIILIIMLWRRVLAAAILLVPYAAWVAYAMYLNYQIWVLN